MARVYLSFLGTNDYVECFYYRDGFEMDRPVRFVQEATILDHCREWGPEDRILIFTTQEAEEKNWRDDGHVDHKTGLPLKRRGLEACLSPPDLKLRAPVSKHSIPDGHDEEQIWTLFEQITHCFQDGDEVVFDITHAFRSIPLLAVVVLNYAKVLKGVRLRSIVYGAFEALGSIQAVKAMPVEKRRVRILDLTPLDQLMDWTIATDRFLATGNAGEAGALAQKGVMEILRETAGADQAAQAIKRLGNSLINFSTTIFTCRGPDISTQASQLKEQLRDASGLDLPRPFRPLFGRLEHRLASFSGNALEDGLVAVRWCIDHNLVQQGYTILEEVVFSYVLEQVGADVQNVRQRLAASQAFTVAARGWIADPDKWGEDGKKDPALTRKIIDFILAHKGLSKAVERIRDRRNDLNHAGFSENGLRVERAARFSTDLHQTLIEVEAVLLGRDRVSP